MSTTSPDQLPNLSRGYFAALASAGILSTTAIFIRYLTQTYQIPALVLTSWRDLLQLSPFFPFWFYLDLYY
ncbi:hypothetical protein ACFLXB_02690 [Chloroflexota bacterium]